MIREAISLEGMPADIEVMPFTGLLVDFCKELGAGGVVKGLRAMTDFEYELQQADLNFHLSPDIESVFVMSSPEYGYVSSSIVREIASMGSPTWTRGCAPTTPDGPAPGSLTFSLSRASAAFARPESATML